MSHQCEKSQRKNEGKAQKSGHKGDKFLITSVALCIVYVYKCAAVKFDTDDD